MKFFLSTSKGFITQHLIKRLFELGHEVDAVGLNGVDSFQLRTQNYDYVIHLAATTSIKQEYNPGIWYNNAVYAEYIINQPFRTIYASSTSAYEMTNVYAHSKAFLETLGERHGNALGLRFFNVYGPGNNKGIVKRVIDCCLSGETLILHGGDQIRDFIYIDDVVDIIIDHLDNPLSVMDVGTGIGTKIVDVCQEISLQMGYKDTDILPFEIKLDQSELIGQQKVSIAYSHPIKDYTPLREGIRKTIELTLKDK